MFRSAGRPARFEGPSAGSCGFGPATFYPDGMTAVSDRIGGDRPVFSVEFFPVTVLISPKEGLQATGHGMTYRPCYP